MSELPPGSRKIVEIDGRSIGVFNVGGRFYALRNTCPHQGAPLCLGTIGGTMADSPPGEYLPTREGEILACPWHGWEFDITTGRSIFNPHRTRVRAYEVTVEEDPAVPAYEVTVADGTVVLHT
ncbi:MAG: Rieske (2Fe-2S) protein [Pseudonocardia sp.]|nr:Rieske (2Fe-2S) protein [Pseudonocardia sp.]